MASIPLSINGTSTRLITPEAVPAENSTESQVSISTHHYYRHHHHHHQHLNPSHTPISISSQPKVRDVKINPNGTLILYQVTQFYRSTSRPLSSLFLAKTNQPHTAIPLTDGQFNDRSGVFHPDGKRILFLSDRQTPGKGSVVYSLPLGHIPTFGVDDQEYHRSDEAVNESHTTTVDEVVDCSVGSTIPEPTILTPKFKDIIIQSFEISPSGQFLAFSTPNGDTKTEIMPALTDSKEIGSSKSGGFSKLHVYDFSKDQIRTFKNVGLDKQIEGFAWSADSKEIVYRLRKNKGAEWSEFEVLLETISVVVKEAKPRLLGSYPRSPSGSNICLSSGHIASLQNYEPRNVLDARTLHIHELAPKYQPSERIYGVHEDAVRILRAHFPSQSHDEKKKDFLAVEVSHDTDSHIDMITFSPSTHTSKFTLFHTFSDAIWFNSWDAKRVVDISDPTSITYVFAAVLSSGPRHEPPNVWSGTIRARLIPNDQTGEEEEIMDNVPLSRSNGNLIRLSNHLQWLSKAAELRTEVIHWKNEDDGTELSGLVRFPPGYDPIRDGRLPTILFLHGGPYRRDIPDYMPYYCNWRELCASAGYLTISPNYRGSQGRGTVFAQSALSGIGTYDWSDCESMVEEVIKRGWGDEERLGIAGWSHGGSLAAWGVSKTKKRFKAAVVGAGAVNWEGMVLESASPELEAAIGGSSPWSSIGGKEFTPESLRKSSPIHNLWGIETAVLILHGERDERVPVGQAYGFYRGLKRCAEKRGREGAKLVVYPREPHGFVERKHAQDVMERVLMHFEEYIYDTRA